MVFLIIQESLFDINVNHSTEIWNSYIVILIAMR